jgi:hypothetical protein
MGNCCRCMERTLWCLSSTYLLLKYLSKYSVLAACLGSMLVKWILSRAQTLSYMIHYTYCIDVPYLVCLALAFKTKVRCPLREKCAFRTKVSKREKNYIARNSILLFPVLVLYFVIVIVSFLSFQLSVQFVQNSYIFDSFGSLECLKNNLAYAVYFIACVPSYTLQATVCTPILLFRLLWWR